MGCMAWNDAMSVGAAMIDQDHRLLIGRLNDLDQAVAQADPAAMHGALQAIFTEIARHFEREETFLDAHRCPELVGHRQRHETFSRQMPSLRFALLNRLASGDGAQVVAHLSHWLNDHILIEDMEYARFLNGKPPGSARAAC
jgi:hemerythrin-like metal-binding protein